MTAKRRPDFVLDQAIEDPGFTPRVRDIRALLDRLAEVTAPGGSAEAGASLGERKSPETAQDLAAKIERALLRAGEPAARGALARASAASAPLRARLTSVLGRFAMALAAQDPLVREVRAYLLGSLSDGDARTRRHAAIALGKLHLAESPSEKRDRAPAHDPEVEAALLAAYAAESSPEVRRALASALGKTGGPAALDALKGTADADPRAVLMATRTAARAEPSAFAVSRAAPGPTAASLRCRAGIERLLVHELDPDLAPRIASPQTGPGRVDVTLTGAPARLFQARTALHFGFPLPAVRLGGESDLPEALIAALSSDQAWRLFDHFTERGAGAPVRYRIAWARGGKRRAVVWQVAEAVQRARPGLLNDPTDSTWEAVVHETWHSRAIEPGKALPPSPSALLVELVPRVDDPRFSYRVGDVPAASHPTVAAALVLAGGVEPADVVWDPFVGSGIELCERALAGPYRSLIGTDRSAAALTIARANLASAGVTEVELGLADACSFAPAAPTLVITNPPMGRRVLRGTDLGAFFDQFLAHVARVLAPSGRLAWASPLPARTARAAASLGLEAVFRQPIDMGGFEAEIQVLRKPEARRSRGGPRAATGAEPPRKARPRSH
jgi:predicted RNA methylase